MSVLNGQQKQRHVQNDAYSTDADISPYAVDQLADTGESAGGDVVGNKIQVVGG